MSRHDLEALCKRWLLNIVNIEYKYPESPKPVKNNLCSFCFSFINRLMMRGTLKLMGVVPSCQKKNDNCSHGDSQRHQRKKKKNNAPYSNMTLFRENECPKLKP